MKSFAFPAITPAKAGPARTAHHGGYESKIKHVKRIVVTWLGERTVCREYWASVSQTLLRH